MDSNALSVVRDLFDHIDAINDRGVTVVIVEQNAKLGLQAADWGVVLDLGKEYIVDSAANILSDPRVSKLYLGGGLKDNGKSNGKDGKS